MGSQVYPEDLPYVRGQHIIGLWQKLWEIENSSATPDETTQFSPEITGNTVDELSLHRENIDSVSPGTLIKLGKNSLHGYFDEQDKALQQVERKEARDQLRDYLRDLIGARLIVSKNAASTDYTFVRDATPYDDNTHTRRVKRQQITGMVTFESTMQLSSSRSDLLLRPVRKALWKPSGHYRASVLDWQGAPQVAIAVN